jgi:alpha-L-rhamnosidase
MNSFNHYAYGAIGEWLYNTVAGIDPDPAAPGYKHVIIRPRPPLPAASGDKAENDGDTIAWARGELMTRYGRVVSHWRIENGVLKLNATIPPNTKATILLPGRRPQKVSAGEWVFEVPFKA